jgi:hypothetical protein
MATSRQGIRVESITNSMMHRFFTAERNWMWSMCMGNTGGSTPTEPPMPSFPATLFPCQHRIATTTLVLRLLVSRLDDFPRIAADLAPLCGSGGVIGYAVVTDGVDVVLVNAEGANYPRYRSARIAAHLLPLIGVTEARLLCARKECHDPDLRITTQDVLNRQCRR